MRNNMVSYWGQPVGVSGITWAQQLKFYTNIVKLVAGKNSTTPGYTWIPRMFSQTLSSVFYSISSQLRVAFYSLSTLLNNNNVSIKYLFSSYLVRSFI